MNHVFDGILVFVKSTALYGTLLATRLIESHKGQNSAKTVLNVIRYGILDVNAINLQHNSDSFGLPYCFFHLHSV